MKKALGLLVALTSLQVMACDYQTYETTIHDTVDSCEELILQANSAKGCEDKTFLKNIMKTGQLSKIRIGATTFCELSTKEGIYSVMSTTMAEPPMATVYFSRVD